MVENFEESLTILRETVTEGQKKEKEHEGEMEDLQKQLQEALKKLQTMEEDMVDPETMDELEGFILRVNAQVHSVSKKIERETAQREAAVKAVVDRVLDNEAALEDVEDSLAGIDSDLESMTGIMKDIVEQQSEVEDKAVKAALGEVANLVEKTTDKVVKIHMEKVKEETSTIVTEIKGSVTKLEDKLKEEQGKRQKSDKKIANLQNQVSVLSVQLEQKADDATLQKVEDMVSVLETQIRSEKRTRAKSEQEVILMREKMSKLEEKMSKEKDVIEHYVTEVNMIETVVTEIHQVETRVETNKTQELMIQQALDEVTKVQTYINSINQKLLLDERQRLESEATLELLSKETRTLFQRVVQNTQRIENLEAQVSEKFEGLKRAVDEVSIRLQVSEQSSRQDLTRLDKLLQQLMQDLSAEVTARKVGDSQAEHTIMLRIQTLISELQMEMASRTTVTVSSRSGGRSASSSSSRCTCTIKIVNGDRTKVCKRDGEVVPDCSRSSTSSSSRGSSSSSSSKCTCRTTIVAGEKTKVCKLNGEVVPDCGSSSRSSSSSSRSSSSRASSSSSKSSCTCKTVTVNGERTLVCKRNGEEVDNC